MSAPKKLPPNDELMAESFIATPDRRTVQQKPIDSRAAVTAAEVNIVHLKDGRYRIEVTQVNTTVHGRQFTRACFINITQDALDFLTHGVLRGVARDRAA